MQFEKPEYGFRAMARVLRNYERRGLNTIRSIISTYAPSTGYKTEEYIRFVTEQLNVSTEQELDVEQNMLPSIKAITTYENGTHYANFYGNHTIELGILLE